MNRTVLFIFILQGFLAGSAMCMGVWAEMPWLGVAGIGLLAASLMVGQFAALSQRHQLSKGALTAAWLFAIAAPCTLLLVRERLKTLDSYYGILAWLVAASVLPASNLIADASLKTRARILAMVWLLFGNTICIAYSYLENKTIGFHVGLALMVVWLVLFKLWFRPPFLGVQVINTLLLICIGLPVADLFIRPTYHFDTRPETGPQYYSYKRAKKNPTAFARWWQYYLSQWHRMGRTVFTKDPKHVLPFRLRPSSESTFFESPIRVNSLGFRGKEVPFEKGNAYRIVTIGESTTFGCTLLKTDQTWPALLEKMINERLKPKRPVQVINAGVPSYTLQHNVWRLAADILPLKPDMIISYHGYNGLQLINEALPPRYGDAPPPYRERPLKLLADCEYRLKMDRWKHGQLAKLTRAEHHYADPMDTAYAKAFETLIDICETNNIRLVLSTFSMAVNEDSDLDAIEFYRGPFHAVHWEVEANAVLTEIVKELAREDPDIDLVDTQPALDGKSEYYTDIVHFTQPGRDIMAELFFKGIRETLQTDLKGQSHTL